MLVALGENEVKTLEDFAECATDDLCGWQERQEEETVNHAGFLDGFDLAREDVEKMIMAARIKAGWITEEDLKQAEEETEDGEAAGEEATAEAAPAEAASSSDTQEAPA